MNNIILIGMPGAGKTTLGKRLSEKLDMNFFDFDDDILEQPGKPTVGHALATLGDEKFLDYEEQETLKLSFRDTVFSCSGSQPLKEKSVNHLRGLGKIIWIDVPAHIIEKRLQTMKVERIVGMGEKSLGEILTWRRHFYETSFDFRFTYEKEGDREDMWEKFYTFLLDNRLIK